MQKSLGIGNAARTAGIGYMAGQGWNYWEVNKLSGKKVNLIGPLFLLVNFPGSRLYKIKKACSENHYRPCALCCNHDVATAYVYSS